MTACAKNLVALFSAAILVAAMSVPTLAETLDPGDIVVTDVEGGNSAIYKLDASAGYARTTIANGGNLSGGVRDVVIESPTSLIAVSSGKLVRVNVTTGATTVITSTTRNDVRAITSNAAKTRIYGGDTDNTGMYSVDVTGGAAPWTLIAGTGGDEPRQPVVDNSTGTLGTLYWAERDSSPGIKKYDLDTAGPISNFVAHAAENNVGLIRDPSTGRFYFTKQVAGVNDIDVYSSTGTFLLTLTVGGTDHMNAAGVGEIWMMDFDGAGNLIVPTLGGGSDGQSRIIQVNLTTGVQTLLHSLATAGTPANNAPRASSVDVVQAAVAEGVPEPSTYLLGLMGLVGFGLFVWRKRKSK